MMGLFLISLLMTLLLQLSEGNPEWKQHTTRKPDNFGEFCLHVSDDSHWTSSASGTQQPHQVHRGILKLKPPNRESTQQPATKSRQSLTHPTLTYMEVPEVHPEIMLPMMAPLPRKLVNACYCNKENMKDPAETSAVRSTSIRWPRKICNSVEVIEILENGRKVCVSPPSLSEYVGDRILRRLVTTAAPPTTELPTTTQPSVQETTQIHESSEEMVFQSCESCSVATDLDNIDVKDIEFLDVKMQSFECSLLIYLYSNVSFGDGKALCLDEDQQGFRTMLKKLEERFYQTPENITDGCRCKERNMQPAVMASQYTSTRVWPPTESCNSTEFIQTMTNGSEVCVNALSLSQYTYVPRRIMESLKVQPSYMLHEVQMENRITYHECVQCLSMGDWNDLDPKDVESINIEVFPEPCPILTSVRLKNKGGFCMSSDQPNFSTFIKKLQDLAN